MICSKHRFRLGMKRHTWLSKLCSVLISLFISLFSRLFSCVHLFSFSEQSQWIFNHHSCSLFSSSSCLFKFQTKKEHCYKACINTTAIEMLALSDSLQPTSYPLNYNQRFFCHDCINSTLSSWVNKSDF